MPKSEVFDRKLVLKKAIDTFHLKGYNATSMQDLVDSTGLNRSSIYNSFGNKLNLYLECLKIYQKDYIALTNAIISKTDCPLRMIESIFEMYLIESTSDKQNKGCLIVNCKSEMANHDESINNFLITNQSNTISMFKDLVTKGQDKEIINANYTALEYAKYLYSALQGFRMTSILLNDEKQLLSIVNIVLGTLK